MSGECVYNKCPSEKFRNNQAQCEPYTYIENCPDGQILIAGKQDNDSINYTEYTPGIEANYDIETMYGHDNLCLPKSDICAANSDDASLISVEYETCPPGQFRNNQALCQPYNYDINIESCENGEIFILGKQDNGSTYYTEYTPGIEADYNTRTIYGHDNLCLSKSNICSANFQDLSNCPDNSCHYDSCSPGEFRNHLAECQAYTDIDITSCSNDEIYILGKQDNGSTNYTAYTPGIEADYSTRTIYGHDNLCLPKSEICY